MLKFSQAIILLLVVFFGFVGISLPYPILAHLFLHSQFATANPYILLGITLAAYPLAQFFGSPVIGSLSDRFGRKKLLILTTFGTGVGYLLSGIAIAHHAVALLIVSRLLTGFLEGNMGIAQASIADMGINKYKGFGAVSAASSLGYVAGPLLGGFLGFNYSLPFYAGTILALLLCSFIIFFFKETNLSLSLKSSSLLSEFNVIKKIKTVYDKKGLRNAFIIMVLLCLSIDAYYEFYPAFLVQKWDMTPKMIGIYTVILSIALSIGAYFVPHYIQKKLNEEAAKKYLLLGFIVALVLLLLANNVYILNMHFILLGLAYSAMNTLQAVSISNQSNQQEQGEVMGLQWGLRMLGDSALCVIGALLLSQSYYLPIMLSIFLAMVTLFMLINLSKYANVYDSKIRKPTDEYF